MQFLDNKFINGYKKKAIWFSMYQLMIKKKHNQFEFNANKINLKIFIGMQLMPYLKINLIVMITMSDTK